MSRTQTLDVAVGEYVGRCIEHLRDLPEETQHEILDDIRQMVAEVSAELDGNPANLLGPPERFVEELRAAAGVANRAAATPRSGSSMKELARSTWAGLSAADLADWIRTLLAELRPAGWVLRGYALGAFVAYSWSDGTAAAHWFLGFLPIPRMSGSAVLGGLVTTVFIAASVAVGRKNLTGWARTAVIGASLASILMLGATTNDLRAQDAERAGMGLIAADSPAAFAPITEVADGGEVATLHDSVSRAQIAAATVSAAVDGWHQLAAGRDSYEITIEWQGNQGSASTAEEVADLLWNWGMSG